MIVIKNLEPITILKMLLASAPIRLKKKIDTSLKTQKIRRRNREIQDPPLSKSKLQYQ
jgi:hypothetical protein